MDAKHRIVQLLGIAGVSSGCLAMNATAVALALLGAWLVVSGIMSRLKRNVDGGESTKIVP